MKTLQLQCLAETSGGQSVMSGGVAGVMTLTILVQPVAPTP